MSPKKSHVNHHTPHRTFVHGSVILVEGITGIRRIEKIFEKAFAHKKGLGKKAKMGVQETDYSFLCGDLNFRIKLQDKQNRKKLLRKIRARFQVNFTLWSFSTFFCISN